MTDCDYCDWSLVVVLIAFLVAGVLLAWIVKP